jgi:hypothetical protein
MGARGPKTIDPSPQEILHRTREIREAWSERTFRLRSGWTVEAADRKDQWTVPQVNLADLCLEIGEEDDYRYSCN